MPHMCGLCGSQKRVLDPLELELLGPGKKKTQSSEKEKVLLTPEPSINPVARC